jgi:hypothetical protein
MTNTLKISAPPPRRTRPESEPAAPEPAPAPKAAEKFTQLKEDSRVQFNKRVTRRVADGFELLAIRTRKKVPELLAEALELLEERHGKV